MITTQTDPRPTPSLEQGALTNVERDVLARAADLRADLMRAAQIARRNGSSYIFFGVVSALMAFSDDPAGLALGVVLVGVGLGARRGSKGLAVGDLAAPGSLVVGEVVLLAGVVLYCVAKMTFLKTSGAEIEQLLGSLGANLDMAALIDSTTDMVYGSIIVIACLYQGGLALYFRARRSALRFYVEDTPEWAREVVGIVAR